MINKNYEEIVLRAKEAVHDLEEPFRSIAFKEVLNDLMRESVESLPPLERAEGIDSSGGFLESHGIQTLRQLINLTKPQSHPAKTLVIAYYSMQAKGLDVFQTESIIDGYREALMKPPTNPSDIIYKNKKKGFFMNMEDEAGESGCSITDQGIKEIESRITKAMEEKD